MLTILHKLDSANEVVYEGDRVSWHECQEAPCPQSSGLTIYSGLVAVHIHGGTAYVMNEAGATVASYVLDEIQDRAISGVSDPNDPSDAIIPLNNPVF